MADEKFEHGKMDTTAQEKAYDGFIKGSIYVSCAAIAVLIIMAVFNS
ncbi:aa3-type cytochrome c oxidase subunit IV [Cochlodiniinecator piscidefendens]|nr:aa3-type cytochrome c oxidase subunit IV [Cochlodiniinecator piscidefendens]